MKFLVDVFAASRILRRTTKRLGHDVLSVRDVHASAADDALLSIAYREGRVLITEDKDFGELVFRRGLPHPSIVRLVEMTPTERADAIRMLIECHADAMCEGAIIVVRGAHVRIRPAGSMERGND